MGGWGASVALQQWAREPAESTLEVRPLAFPGRRVLIVAFQLSYAVCFSTGRVFTVGLIMSGDGAGGGGQAGNGGAAMPLTQEQIGELSRILCASLSATVQQAVSNQLKEALPKNLAECIPTCNTVVAQSLAAGARLTVFKTLIRLYNVPCSFSAVGFSW